MLAAGGILVPERPVSGLGEGPGLRLTVARRRQIAAEIIVASIARLLGIPLRGAGLRRRWQAIEGQRLAHGLRRVAVVTPHGLRKVIALAVLLARRAVRGITLLRIGAGRPTR